MSPAVALAPGHGKRRNPTMCSASKASLWQLSVGLCRFDCKPYGKRLTDGLPVRVRVLWCNSPILRVCRRVRAAFFLLSFYFYRCAYHTCRGSREQLKAYQQEHYDDLERAMTQRALLASVELDYQSAMCSEGYKGHLCSTCGPNRSKTRNYVCGTCTGGGRVVLITLIGTVLGMAYLWFISASTIKDSQAPWGTLKVSDATYCLTWFLQLLFVLATVPVTWPTAISWLPKTAETLLSSFSSSTSSLACLVKPSQSMPSIAGQMMIIQLCLMLIMPVVVVLLQLLSAACKPVIRKLITCLKAQARRPGVVPRTARASRTAKSFPWKQDIIVTVLSSLLFFYPTILQSTMSLFVCKPLDPAGGSERVYQVRAQCMQP